MYNIYLFRRVLGEGECKLRGGDIKAQRGSRTDGERRVCRPSSYLPSPISCDANSVVNQTKISPIIGFATWAIALGGIFFYAYNTFLSFLLEFVGLYATVTLLLHILNNQDLILNLVLLRPSDVEICYHSCYKNRTLTDKRDLGIPDTGNA